MKDFDARLRAVGTFVALPSAAGLAAANKRISNLLRKADYDSADAPDPALLTEDAETALAAALAEARESVTPLLEERAYTDVLTRLSELREPVDAFFEDVHGNGGGQRRPAEPPGPAVCPASRISERCGRVPPFNQVTRGTVRR